MLGAVGVAAPGYELSRRLARPILADRFSEPATAAIDRRLVVGAALFGVGWGLVGLCPGPAFTALATAGWPAALFVAFMLAGMMAARHVPAWLQARGSAEA
jgi:uncharacterized membrane protein YedE/YeeE